MRRCGEEMRWRCGGDADEKQRRYGGDAEEMQRRCGGDAVKTPTTYLQCEYLGGYYLTTLLLAAFDSYLLASTAYRPGEYYLLWRVPWREIPLEIPRGRSQGVTRPRSECAAPRVV